MSRNTKTGKVLEDMILPSLKQGGYTVQTQQNIGKRPGGKTHQIDCIAEKNSKKIFISLKWQQSQGTAEQKVPYEVICLAKLIFEDKQQNVTAYLILGGTDNKGWTLRDFYIKGGLDDYLHPNYKGLVKILKTDDFIALANKSKL